jgi:hypothetical protein
VPFYQTHGKSSTLFHDKRPMVGINMGPKTKSEHLSEILRKQI